MNEIEKPCPTCGGWVGEDCDCVEYLADVQHDGIGPPFCEPCTAECPVCGEAS